MAEPESAFRCLTSQPSAMLWLHHAAVHVTYHKWVVRHGSGERQRKINLYFNPKAPRSWPRWEHLDRMGGVKHGRCESDRMGLMSVLCHWLAMWPWKRYKPLAFSFLIWEINTLLTVLTWEWKRSDKAWCLTYSRHPKEFINPLPYSVPVTQDSPKSSIHIEAPPWGRATWDRN